MCIATSDLVGPIRNGGVGTACTTLAEALALAGHEVTLLYAGPFEAGDAAHWRAHYADRRITFDVPLPSEVPLEGMPHACTSYLAYEWLKRHQVFDVIQFPDINGLGFYSLQAKRLGLAFQQTCCCVVLHSPTLWHRLENGQRVDHEEDLALDFIERKSVAWADVLVSPTNYLLSWADNWGFQFPREVYVQPYVSPAARPRTPERPNRISEIVFFGRLETRKGLELFCDALDILAARRGMNGTTVTFLGKSGLVGDEDGARFVRRRSARLGVPVRLETARDQLEALDYLRGRPALAVMPSLADNMPYTVLECLAEGISFLSTMTGGIPEMIAPEDRASVLAAPEPTALADLIERGLREGVSPCRNAIDPDVVRRQWIAWHEHRIASAAAPTAPAQTRPLVSVCVATRNRPAVLLEALESIRSQTYSPLEVVLVDDASDSPEAVEVLSRLEPDFTSRGWQIIRRPVKGFPSAARNTAAAHAHGEYLLFMDDDNLARPHEIETFVRASRHSGVPLVTCILDQFRDEPGRAGAHVPFLRWLPLGPALALGVLSNKFGDTNMLVRRDTFLSLGGFDEDRAAAFVEEDWIFLSRAALAGVEMAVVPEPLFLYRIWDGMNHSRRSHYASEHRRLAPYLEGESPDRRGLTLYAAGLHERLAALEYLTQSDEARAKTLAVRFARAAPLMTIGPGGVRSLTPLRDIEISQAEDGILMRSVGSDPSVWLPACPPPLTHSIVRLELSTSRPTSVQLFWSTEAVPYPSEEQSTIVGFPAGRHTRWGEIPAAAHVGRLRLDPSFTTGDYVLHELEIRCELYGASYRPRGLAKLVPRFRRPSPEVPMADRFSRARIVIDVAAEPGNFTPVRGVEIARSSEGILLRSLDRDPQVQLPAFHAHGHPMIARLEATSSSQTTAQLFWTTRRRSYCEQQSTQISLAAGLNVGYFAIPRNALRPLRFDPATSPCEVVVHSLEIRAET